MWLDLKLDNITHSLFNLFLVTYYYIFIINNVINFN